MPIITLSANCLIVTSKTLSAPIWFKALLIKFTKTCSNLVLSPLTYILSLFFCMLTFIFFSLNIGSYLFKILSTSSHILKLYLILHIQVLKEDHEILSWVFHRTPIPHLISEQLKVNMTLSIDKRGEFQVVWHLAGDLKTLKCLFNCSKGANAKSPCLYCMDSANHLDSKWWRRPPNRNLLDENFSPVFDIPLVNVHICTLHGLCRIIEKLVYLHIGFAWKIKNALERITAITTLERVLHWVAWQKCLDCEGFEEVV